MSSYWMSSSKTFLEVTLWRIHSSYHIDHRIHVPSWFIHTVQLEFLTKIVLEKKCQILGVDIVKKLNNKKSWLPKILRSRDFVMKILGKWSHGSNWLTDTISSWKNKIKFSFPKKVWRGGYSQMGQDDVIDYTDCKKTSSWRQKFTWSLWTLPESVLALDFDRIHERCDQ